MREYLPWIIAGLTSAAVPIAVWLGRRRGLSERENQDDALAEARAKIEEQARALDTLLSADDPGDALDTYVQTTIAQVVLGYEQPPHKVTTMAWGHPSRLTDYNFDRLEALLTRMLGDPIYEPGRGVKDGGRAEFVGSTYPVHHYPKMWLLGEVELTLKPMKPLCLRGPPERTAVVMAALEGHLGMKKIGKYSPEELVAKAATLDLGEVVYATEDNPNATVEELAREM